MFDHDRIDPSGKHVRHSDAMMAHFLPEYLKKAGHCRLRGNIGSIGRQTDFAIHARDGKDVTTLLSEHVG
jgi:hypothetical protein